MNNIVNIRSRKNRYVKCRRYEQQIPKKRGNERSEGKENHQHENLKVNSPGIA